MSMWDEVELFTKLSGRDGEHTPIGIIGSFLDGYDKGKEDATKWIPCSERLPEENDEVIISARYIEYLSNRGSYVEVGYFAKGSWYTAENDECYDAFLAEVTAWMPLPEPYKADMRGEHENK